MNPQINAITLGVEDIERSKEFYAEGLGCAIQQDHGVFVMLDLGGGSSLGLYTRAGLAEDAGVPAKGSGFPGFTLSFFAASEADVDDVLAKAEKAGGTILKPGQSAEYGGYFGTFADPDGYLWKIVTSS